MRNDFDAATPQRTRLYERKTSIIYGGNKQHQRDFDFVFWIHPLRPGGQLDNKLTNKQEI